MVKIGHCTLNKVENITEGDLLMSSDEYLEKNWAKMFSRYPFCVFASRIRASGLASRLTLNGIRLVCWAENEHERREVCQQWLEVTAVSRGEKHTPPWIVIVDHDVQIREITELVKFAVVVLLNRDLANNVAKVILPSPLLLVSVVEQLTSLVNHIVKQER